MADITVDELPAKADLLDGDNFVLDDGAQSYKVSIAQLKNLFKDSFVPTGAVIPFPVSSKTGYVLCDGRAISRTEYADLYDVIGTSFGAGDGSTTFNVPDYRGCFLRGLGGNSAADMYTKQESGSPNITGYDVIGWYGVNPGTLNNSTDRSGALAAPLQVRDGQSPTGTGGGTYNIARGVAFDASLSSSVYKNGLTEARPTNYAVNFFIKA